MLKKRFCKIGRYCLSHTSCTKVSPREWLANCPWGRADRSNFYPAIEVSGCKNRKHFGVVSYITYTTLQWQVIPDIEEFKTSRENNFTGFNCLKMRSQLSMASTHEHEFVWSHNWKDSYYCSLQTNISNNLPPITQNHCPVLKMVAGTKYYWLRSIQSSPKRCQDYKTISTDVANVLFDSRIIWHSIPVNESNDNVDSSQANSLQSCLACLVWNFWQQQPFISKLVSRLNASILQQSPDSGVRLPETLGFFSFDAD